MGLFGSNNNKDDTRAKIEELKAKMQGGGAQQAPTQPEQSWQQQAPTQPEQSWQPPREQTPTTTSTSHEKGILLELGEGMSLNLPIKEKMRLDEFLRVADRVRELKKIDRS